MILRVTPFVFWKVPARPSHDLFSQAAVSTPDDRGAG